MSRKRKIRNRNARQQGLNFVVTLITLSLIFGFIGYLIPQYAIQKVRKQRQSEEEFISPKPVTTPVTTAPVSPPPKKDDPPKPPQVPPSPTELYRVQVGVFSQKANADRMLVLLEEAGYEAIKSDEAPYRVQTGAFNSQENAQKLAQELRDKGFEAIVVR